MSRFIPFHLKRRRILCSLDNVPSTNPYVPESMLIAEGKTVA